jgi:hypothetical protein
LLTTPNFCAGVLSNKAKDKKVFVSVHCDRFPFITEVRVDARASPGSEASCSLVGLELDSRTERLLEPQDILVKGLEAFQAGGSAGFGVIVQGKYPGRVVKCTKNDAGLPDSKRTVSVVRAQGPSQKFMVRDYTDVAKARHASS